MTPDTEESKSKNQALIGIGTMVLMAVICAALANLATIKDNQHVWPIPKHNEYLFPNFVMFMSWLFLAVAALCWTIRTV